MLTSLLQVYLQVVEVFKALVQKRWENENWVGLAFGVESAVMQLLYLTTVVQVAWAMKQSSQFSSQSTLKPSTMPISFEYWLKK